ncbi:hypothetical protein GF336_01035 [Candidatus Woesearchaeota archaeon]|nr:hypothetical protein [Candidatus Woesearchaeota archaeon]
MGIFSSLSQKDSHVHKLHQAVSFAFQKVKDDTSQIFQWLQHFHQKQQDTDQRLARIEEHIASSDSQDSLELKQRLRKLEYHTQYQPQISREEIRRIAENSVSYDHILRKIEEINLRIDTLEKRKSAQRIEKKQSIKDRIVKKITKNSKDYIKSVVLSLIKKYQQISGSQLREIVVEEQGLCSKSSFYRALEELEQSSDIEMMKKGKEKTYAFKTTIQR